MIYTKATAAILYLTNVNYHGESGKTDIFELSNETKYGMTERSIPHIRDIFEKERLDAGGCGDRIDGKKRPVVPRSEPDLKHIDRHLSMKKTIRKKIMRDLQQAFVAESGEKDVEIHVVDAAGKEGFLDVLRKGGRDEKEDQNKDYKEEDKKQGFWRRFTMRRNKR